MDLDQLDLDTTTAESSQRSTLSPHSSHQAGFGRGSQQDIGGLIIPQSASSFVGGPAGGFGGLSSHGSARRGMDEAVLLDDDLGLTVGDDGALLDMLPMRQSTALPLRGDGTDVSGARDRSVQGDGAQAPDMVSQHDTYVLFHVADSLQLGQPDEDGFMPLQDDYNFVSDAPPVAAPLDDEEELQQQETSEETAAAPLRRRARPARKTIPLDSTMELRNGDLAHWSTEYLSNMQEALRHKNALKAVAQAKKNAEFWMLGQSDAGPLSMFQGAKFIEALTGINLDGSGRKRSRDEGYETDETRRKRSRGEEALSDEIARGVEYDDGYMLMAEDDTIEQGRDAPTPLDDRHLSSMMPWNQSAGSRRPTTLFSGTGQHRATSASLGPGGMQLNFPARRGSRLTSASPLQGRGVPGPGAEIDYYQLPGSQGDIGMSGMDEFELYGPAANVDTQTAAQSQWQRAALDGESGNFLEFVKAGVEKAHEDRAGAVVGDQEDKALQSTVDFETLLPPHDNTYVVAAQAMLHVLSLGTKNLLSVVQSEDFGAITLRPVAAV